MMLSCAGAMLGASLRLAELILILAATAGALIVALSAIMHGFVVSWWGAALTLVWASLFLVLRKAGAHGRL